MHDTEPPMAALDLLLVQGGPGAMPDPTDTLRRLGHRPFAVSDLTAAVARLAHLAVDAVLVDMPPEDLERNPAFHELAAGQALVVLLDGEAPPWLADLDVTLLPREKAGRHWERLADLVTRIEEPAEEPPEEAPAADPRLSELQANVFVRLMAGLAHDINNVLSGVMGYASLLSHKLGERHPDSRFAKAIADSAARAAGMTDQALQSIRLLGHGSRPASLGDLLDGAERLMVAALPKSLGLDRQFGPELPAANCPPGELLSLLVGVCLHVGDAVGLNSSTLKIRARALPAEGSALTVIEVEFTHDLFSEDQDAAEIVAGRGGIQVPPVPLDLLQEMAQRLGGDIEAETAEDARTLRLRLVAAAP